MNVLDENVPDHQRRPLRRARIAVHQVGFEVGRKGWDDEQVVRLLFQLRQPTFFTFDEDYYRGSLCNDQYCLVWLDVHEAEGAAYIRRVLKHSDFDTHAKRMGCVVKVSPDGLTVLRRHMKESITLEWPST